MSTRFWVPVRSSSTEAYWPVRPMVRRTWCGWVATSYPPTRARARVGLEQGREDADGGGLAGAVRAEDAEDGAGGNGEVDPVEGLGGAEALPEPLGLDHEVW